MHIPLEQLTLLLYLDSLFIEGGTREVTPRREVPETLNRLHTQAMREHDRQRALLSRVGAEWSAVPDWRLDRQIIRLALYLRERLGLEPGDRVVLLSELGPEWLFADLAALGLGAVSVAIDPSLPRDALSAALEDAAPRVTFASPTGQLVLTSLDGRAPAHGELVALGSAAREDVTLLRTMLEMGGTLDTPERAQAYRADARAVAPSRPAIRHFHPGPGGGCEWAELSQGEVIERLNAEWLREPAQPGDLAYIADPTVSLATRLSMYAFLGNGYTTTAIAPAGGDLADLAALHPTDLVAPAALLAEAVGMGLAGASARRDGDGGWLRRTMRLAPLARARNAHDAIRNVLGGRVRRIGVTEPLDSANAEWLAAVAVVEPLRT